MTDRDVSLRIVETLGRTRDGGSCAECDADYVGFGTCGHTKRGYQVLAECNPGHVDLFNLCYGCYRQLGERP